MASPSLHNKSSSAGEKICHIEHLGGWAVGYFKTKNEGEAGTAPWTADLRDCLLLLCAGPSVSPAHPPLLSFQALENRSTAGALPELPDSLPHPSSSLLPGKEPSLTVVALKKGKKKSSKAIGSHAWETGFPFRKVRYATSHNGAKCSKQTQERGVMNSELLAPVVLRQA